jgi:hypothetical protein
MRWAGGISGVCALAALGCSSTPLALSRSGEGEISVTLLRQLDQSGRDNGTVYNLNALWRPGPTYVVQHGCTTTPSGPCMVTACNIPPGASDAPSSSLDAGALSFAENGAPVATLVYGAAVPGTAPSYATGVGSTALFASGEVSVSGSGGADLPAFSAVSLPAPSAFSVVEPVCSAGMCAPSSAAQGMPVAWTGGNPGTVYVYLSAQTDAQLVAIACEYDSQLGRVTIPGETVAQLPSSSAAFQISSFNELSFQLDEMQTSFVVSRLGLEGSVPITP